MCYFKETYIQLAEIAADSIVPKSGVTLKLSISPDLATSISDAPSAESGGTESAK